MSSHLGRNPFQKPSSLDRSSHAQRHPTKSAVQKLLVDLPTETFLLAVKTVLLIKSVLKTSSKE